MNATFRDSIAALWTNMDKEIDPNFEGSIFQKLGLSASLCPTCDAHLKKIEGEVFICLNACHLGLVKKPPTSDIEQIIDNLTRSTV